MGYATAGRMFVRSFAQDRRSAAIQPTLFLYTYDGHNIKP